LKKDEQAGIMIYEELALQTGLRGKNLMILLLNTSIRVKKEKKKLMK
jgi:hypothetical protein